MHSVHPEALLRPQGSGASWKHFDRLFSSLSQRHCLGVCRISGRPSSSFRLMPVAICPSMTLDLRPIDKCAPEESTQGKSQPERARSFSLSGVPLIIGTCTNGGSVLFRPTNVESTCRGRRTADVPSRRDYLGFDDNSILVGVDLQ